MKVIQYREKNIPISITYRECQAIRGLCHRFGACFIVNDDVGLALASKADGLHLGQADLPAEAARRIVGPDMLIGLSVSSVPEAEAAAKAGIADYLGAGPVYSTSTKKDAGKAIGLGCLRAIKNISPVPVVAIGGVNQDNITEVFKHGADCVAIIGGIVGAVDIGKRINQIQTVIRDCA